MMKKRNQREKQGEADLVSMREALEILEVSSHTLSEWIRKGVLKAVPRDGEPGFLHDEIRRAFERHRPPPPESRRSILVIDDDPLVGRSLIRLLEKAGFEVTVAPLGLQALDLASRKSVDLILADIRMPGMDGLATLKAIREIRQQSGLPAIPAIVMTAFDEEGAREEAERIGIRDFLLKPFEVKDLLEAMERAMK